MDEKDFSIKRAEEEYQAYKALFKCVLLQAVHDAFISNEQTTMAKVEKLRALAFLSGGDDLRMVCDIAEVSYWRIVRVINQAKKANKLTYKALLDVLNKKNVKNIKKGG